MPGSDGRSVFSLPRSTPLPAATKASRRHTQPNLMTKKAALRRPAAASVQLTHAMAIRWVLPVLLLLLLSCSTAQAQAAFRATPCTAEPAAAANALGWACSADASSTGLYSPNTVCEAQCDTEVNPAFAGTVSAVCEFGKWRIVGACAAPPPICLKGGVDVCKTIFMGVPGTCQVNPRDPVGFKCRCEDGYVWRSRNNPTSPCSRLLVRMVLEKDTTPIKAAEEDVVAAGGGKKLSTVKRKGNDGKWTREKLPANLPGTIEAASSGGPEALAVGPGGLVLQSINGSDWKTLVAPSSKGDTQTAVAIDHVTKEAWTVGPNGVNHRNNRGRWNKMPANKLDRQKRWTYNDVCRSKSKTSKNTFAIGKGRSTDKTGQLYIWNSKDSNFDRAAEVRRAPLAITALSDTWVWITGEGGYIGRWDGKKITETPSGTNVNLNSVDVLDETTAWAVGDNGTTLEWDGKAWSPRISPVNDNLRKVTVTGSDDAIASSNDNVLVWDGVSWQTDTSANKPAFGEWAAAASADGEGARRLLSRRSWLGRQLLQRDPRCWDDWSNWWCRAVAHFADYDWALER